MTVPEYATTPPAELEVRKDNFQQRLRESHLDGALILQQADKFYFTGTVQDGVVFIPAEGEALFLVRKSYERALSMRSAYWSRTLTTSYGWACQPLSAWRLITPRHSENHDHNCSHR